MENTNKTVGYLIGILLVVSVLIAVAQTNKDTFTTSTIANESIPITANTGTLKNNDLISLNGLRNNTANSVINSCNISLSTASLTCNATVNNGCCYADYQYYPDVYVKNNAPVRALLAVIIIIVAVIIIKGFWKKEK